MSSTDSLEEEGFFCESLATFYPSSISADSGYDTNRSSLSIELSEAEHEGARRRAAFKASDESMERFLEDCREFMLDFESDPECHGGTELDDYIQEAEDYIQEAEPGISRLTGREDQKSQLLIYILTVVKWTPHQQRVAAVGA